MQNNKKIAKLLLPLTALLLTLGLIVPLGAAASGTSLQFDYVTVTEPTAAPTDGAVSVEADLPAPVIIETTKGLPFMALMTFYDGSENSEGLYDFTTLSDGIGALQLKYSPYKEYAPYRCMPRLNDKNLITDQHKYVRITYMTTDTAPASLDLRNYYNGDAVTVVPNTTVSAGQFVISDAVDISTVGLVERLKAPKHMSIEFTSKNANAEFYIREIAFFASEAQAYAHYGDEASASSQFASMTFGDAGNGVIYGGKPEYGNCEINTATGTVDIKYAETTNQGVHYMAKLKFNAKELVSADNIFVRVLYSAKNPEGTKDADLFLCCDGSTKYKFLIQENIPDTNGEFVLSDIGVFNEYAMDRFSGTRSYQKAMHNSFNISAAKDGGLYSIKAVYFFPTRAAAEDFTLDKTGTKLTLNGTNIKNYQIVIPEESPVVEVCANILNSQINKLVGVSLPVVTDSAPAAQYEILLGKSSRELSRSVLAEYPEDSDTYRRYAVKMSGTTLVITSENTFSMDTAVNEFVNGYLYGKDANIPSDINISDKVSYSGFGERLTTYEKWDDFTNVEDPIVFTDDFSADNGYWHEENTGYWNEGVTRKRAVALKSRGFDIANGALTTNAASDEFNFSYLQVFEANAEFSAKFKYTTAGKNGDFGLALRYNDTQNFSYVKAGYDFTKGEWYIEYREGRDFYIERVASKKATLAAGTEYTLTFTAVDKSASLTVNGETVLTTDKAMHVTPGRIGIYASDASVSADDVKVVLLSGTGTIMKNVAHTSFYKYEGFTVIEMLDGSLRLEHKSGNEVSYDDGKTWSKAEKIFSYGSYPHILRLENKELLVIDIENGWRWAYVSTDEGKTWTKRGKICEDATQMNDKVTQISTGRIFYVQPYNITSDSGNRENVYCEVFYSDDNGMTWTKSKNNSLDVYDDNYFGEPKILECADGTIRIYSSWNREGCVSYIDSHDGGVTWSEYGEYPELICARSSMAFARDPYAENATTYYMAWVNSETEPGRDGHNMTRLRWSLARTTDGKTWEFLGDMWWWESPYRKTTGSNGLLQQICDTFLSVTKNAVLLGGGFSESLELPGESYHDSHGVQIGQLWSIPRESLTEGKKINKFTDIQLGAPYYEAVTYVSDAGLFQGTAENSFSPDMAMTRSMFVTVLGRLNGADVSKYTKPTFSDVAAGQWYTSYVEWAAANGVVNGIGNGLYGINDNVTIEQACVMLSRYAQNKSAAKASGKTLASFADSASVSSWAADAVNWAVENGVYNGQNGKLNPTSPASRAAVATMFYNYVNVYGK